MDGNTLHLSGVQVARDMTAVSLADAAKDIRRRHLRRSILEDPSLARALVAIEASPVYNERGRLIQAVTSSTSGVA
ncbi:hypothetical protein Dde_2450 [Oleidesulfovibrio alaskensis G20]|jgi:hypothetical protein|uniref:Uncharacterized protein n=1 Tax=Oleidesulfovibrio alaskensis (strain ATCC BAA-1058 / DSM 17464 / G20) TaxID=207559 RepID=Q30YJ9_OLEA2|nr:hypothetical protein [Oleidesulfovibrio alaskensis]ABB39247.1 hypothetical protein Dde_2450 [Oleidesulfovibrio alaskensis G20]MBG0771998.1 hypothetical protein [Oleidesulfovibrio alaskensis]MBL3581764.1 hypothetical protein [Oleidesulfovibrio alaskensis]